MPKQILPPLPTSAKEVAARGWESLDVILFTGDAYVDHPSFGTAVIARLLEAEGYRVAVVPQPNWRDDLRDFRKLGTPRLFFGVSAGAMDSMVNHYTAARRLRSDDAYTPDGRAGQRPDYPTEVYTRILKQLFPQTPVIIGGIEASLRRFTHYDYWQDKLHASILATSGADLLSYGMGDRVILEIARALHNGFNMNLLRKIPQVAYMADSVPEDTLVLNTYEQCVASPKAFGENFVHIETESNRINAHRLAEAVGDRYVVVNPPYPFLEQEEIDHSFDLPYTRLPHPRYRGKGAISAYEMIKHSVNIHRGCFGGCSFCTISAHQGKFISSRSEASIIAEVEAVAQMDDFRGNLSDVGGPSANMYGMRGRDSEKCDKCSRPSCIFPKICPNLNNDHRPLLDLYAKIRAVRGVKRAYIGSGIRYDLFDESDYLTQVLLHHTSGRLKVAPEHTSDSVLKLMRKPPFTLFEELNKNFNKICSNEGLPYQLIPYFISSHPGCTEADMQSLSQITRSLNFRLEQVQDLTPTPMTLSSVMFYTGFNPYTGEKVYVARSREEKDRQKSYFFSPNTGQRATGRITDRSADHGLNRDRSRTANPSKGGQTDNNRPKNRGTAYKSRPWHNNSSPAKKRS